MPLAQVYSGLRCVYSSVYIQLRKYAREIYTAKHCSPYYSIRYILLHNLHYNTVCVVLASVLAFTWVDASD